MKKATLKDAILFIKENKISNYFNYKDWSNYQLIILTKLFPYSWHAFCENKIHKNAKFNKLILKKEGVNDE